MSSTFGDKTDVVWFKKHNLAISLLSALMVIFTARSWASRGMRVHSAREKILELLEEAGLSKTKEPLPIPLMCMSGAKKRSNISFSSMVFSLLPYKQTFIELGKD